MALPCHIEQLSSGLSRKQALLTHETVEANFGLQQD
jgi:hypothetical protein